MVNIALIDLPSVVMVPIAWLGRAQCLGWIRHFVPGCNWHCGKLGHAVGGRRRPWCRSMGDAPCELCVCGAALPRSTGVLSHGTLFFLQKAASWLAARGLDVQWVLDNAEEWHSVGTLPFFSFSFDLPCRCTHNVMYTWQRSP